VAPRKPRAIYSAPEQQVGEQSNTAAGGNINHGIPPEQAFDLVKFLWEDRQDRDIRREQLDHTLQDMRDQIELYRITLAQRITAITVSVDVLAAASAQQARETRRLRRWVTGLTAGVLAGAVLLGAAYVLRLPPFDPAALLRLWLGAALALAAQSWRR
jgi:hypothetical protein